MIAVMSDESCQLSLQKRYFCMILATLIVIGVLVEIEVVLSFRI